jgi:hypothetical protein
MTRTPAWATGLTESFPIPLDHLSPAQRLLLDDSIDDPPLPPSQPVNFFALPSELRNRIYTLLLFSPPTYRRKAGKRTSTRLSILTASKRTHSEATYILYTRHSFRVFPLQDFAPKPTIADLPRHYAKLVTNLELTLGSSWTSPPKEWRVTPALAKCLAGLDAVQTLRIFIELDPSHPVFARYRVSLGFYTDFCGKLLMAILGVMPRLRFVELDGNPSVQKGGPLVRRLWRVSVEGGREIKWGRERGWAHDVVVFENGREMEEEEVESE